MTKRARTLTGGTGDIKPQILTMTTPVAAGTSDYTLRQINLPVSRFGSQKTKTTVFEILSVDWFMAIEDMLDTIVVNWAFITTNVSRVQDETASLATLREDLEDPLTLAFAVSNHNVVTTGAWQHTMPIHIDMTDGAGNGVLIATDRVFIVGGNLNGAAPGGYIAKVKYRLSAVGITEYIGIVQSQQG